MNDPRRRAIWVAGVALGLVWLLVWGVQRLASHAIVTAEKLTAQVETLDLSTLKAKQRAQRLQDLAEAVNRLDPEERRKLRLGRTLDSLLVQMSEEEKGRFIEATMPTGLKQVLTAFEKMPEDRRQRTITNAVERLRRAREEMMPPGQGTNPAPVVSEELQKKAVALGLQTFYSESTAQTKAELAPLLEELQRSMNSGRFMRDMR
jgi:hypothetical protein